MWPNRHLHIAMCMVRSLVQWLKPGKSEIAGSNPTLAWAYISAQRWPRKPHLISLMRASELIIYRPTFVEMAKQCFC